MSNLNAQSSTGRDPLIEYFSREAAGRDMLWDHPEVLGIFHAAIQRAMGGGYLIATTKRYEGRYPKFTPQSLINIAEDHVPALTEKISSLRLALPITQRSTIYYGFYVASYASHAAGNRPTEENRDFYHYARTFNKFIHDLTNAGIISGWSNGAAHSIAGGGYRNTELQSYPLVPLARDVDDLRAKLEPVVQAYEQQRARDKECAARLAKELDTPVSAFCGVIFVTLPVFNKDYNPTMTRGGVEIAEVEEKGSRIQKALNDFESLEEGVFTRDRRIKWKHHYSRDSHDTAQTILHIKDHARFLQVLDDVGPIMDPPAPAPVAAGNTAAVLAPA